MLFGFRDEFVYFQCANCGCLQIQEVPDNLEKYYPRSYWGSVQDKPLYSKKPLRNLLVKQRTNYYLSRPNFFGEVLADLTRIGEAPVFGGWNWREDLKHAGLRLNSAILDVGCAFGAILGYLKDQGFSNLTGIDAYIEKDIDLDGIRIYKKQLRDLEGQFDFITLHHSFEHMDEPEQVLGHLYRLLRPGRYALIRIPVASSFAWEHYGTNWVQLDAPRHLFLHTPDSMKILCDRIGFRLEKIVYDSNEFQFWVSEGYGKDIPFVENKLSNYSRDEKESFRARARELNQEQRGDQACFYLFKPRGEGERAAVVSNTSQGNDRV
jgi:2-polyprenyl-3-methyl-5-hydroxy-6-metoxy-1,4-benzoquinol methylase